MSRGGTACALALAVLFVSARESAALTSAFRHTAFRSRAAQRLQQLSITGEGGADAASKLLPKVAADGSTKFDNPRVGDFQVFDALQKYPTWASIKVVAAGGNDGNHCGVGDDLQLAIAQATGQALDKVTVEATPYGKYTRLSLRVWTTSSDKLYSAYEAIDKDARVKFKF
eukprot:TRINITY_DN4137_c0_g1_i1.p1 TRINITY_DN4137_c0_g1~~TRINITY_DN4137_c0_g1_i1.p1  ORF type:complete len:181 (-),score=19.40 TRINITY_DN4137_c0_g1_i1:11-523(-)